MWQSNSAHPLYLEGLKKEKTPLLYRQTIVKNFKKYKFYMKLEILIILIVFFSGCVYYNAGDSSLGETTIEDTTFVIKPFQTYYYV